MKKFLIFLIATVLVLSLVACGNNKAADYKNEVDFENALNAGEDVIGKTVSISVKELVPNSAFGYNIQAGEHLNFCSEGNPNVAVGDTITVKVTEVTSMLGSYIITYKKVK